MGRQILGERMGGCLVFLNTPQNELSPWNKLLVELVMQALELVIQAHRGHSVSCVHKLGFLMPGHICSYDPLLINSLNVSLTGRRERR